MRNLVTSLAVLGGLLVTTGAVAEEAAAQSSGQANVGMSLPGAAPATATAGTSDHDQVVGRLAVGYFGVTTIGAGAGGGDLITDSTYSVVGNAPVVGVRYWLNNMIGLDMGLGIGILGGTNTATVGGAAEVNTNKDSFTGFGIHGGVPLALASTGHFTFEIIPEANIAFATAKADTDNVAEGEITNKGFHFDIGARAGAEIHFGFISLPQLSLQGSVGLAFAIDNGTTTDTTPAPPAPDNEFSSHRNGFTTTVGNEPWDIFTGNVAALYYF